MILLDLDSSLFFLLTLACTAVTDMMENNGVNFLDASVLLTILFYRKNDFVLFFSLLVVHHSYFKIVANIIGIRILLIAY